MIYYNCSKGTEQNLQNYKNLKGEQNNDKHTD